MQNAGLLTSELVTNVVTHARSAGELVAYRHEGFWFAMDTPRDYRQLADLAAAGNPPWAVWERGRS